MITAILHHHLDFILAHGRGVHIYTVVIIFHYKTSLFFIEYFHVLTEYTA